MNLNELCERDVISLSSGDNLGNIDDLCFDEISAKITHIVIYGRAKLFGILGREEDTLIAWEEIAKIGSDVVLITGLGNIPPVKKGFKFKFK